MLKSLVSLWLVAAVSARGVKRPAFSPALAVEAVDPTIPNISINPSETVTVTGSQSTSVAATTTDDSDGQNTIPTISINPSTTVTLEDGAGSSTAAATSSTAAMVTMTAGDSEGDESTIPVISINPSATVTETGDASAPSATASTSSEAAGAAPTTLFTRTITTELPAATEVPDSGAGSGSAQGAGLFSQCGGTGASATECAQGTCVGNTLYAICLPASWVASFS